MFVISRALATTLLLLGTLVHAQQAPIPPCTPTMLQTRFLESPKTESPETASNAHWLAVEAQNRSKTLCHFSGVTTTFPPYQQLSIRWGSDTSEAASAFKEKKGDLGPGETAHFLLAWTSAPVGSLQLPMYDCAIHDTMELSSGNINDSSFVKVRHLAMQSCGQPWQSAYRLGPYVPDEPIEQAWLDYAGLKMSDFAKVNVSHTGTGSPEVSLRSLDRVEYLKGTFESGYSGYFELYLKLNSPARSNCLFDTLRKREANGHTDIYVNHCPPGSTPAVVRKDGKETRLLVRELGMLPERAGEVQYEVASRVIRDGEPVLARAETQISVRDPKQPTLPVIDTTLTSCTAAQLRLTTPAAELGTHWHEARSYASSGQEWHDAKAFEFTNASDRSCMVGGVPELTFLEPPEIKTGFLSIPVCRNCGTPTFQPRESRWIELKPGDSAHFIVDRRVLDSDHFYTCTVIGGLKLVFPDKGTATLPFEAGSCGQVNVSAWRAGKYDRDPNNIRYDEREKRREEKRLSEANPLPKECAASISADTGKPVMFPSRGPVAWGISTRPSVYGNGTPVLLWIYNPTDVPQRVMTCMGIDGFWQQGIDVFDSAGQRVLSRNEERERAAQASGKFISITGRCGMSCSRNFPIEIPPHTCLHTTFSAAAYDFSRNLQEYYSLPPGEYFVVPSENAPGTCAPAKRTVIDPPVGLAVDVLQP